MGLVHWLPVLVVNLIMFNQIRSGRRWGEGGTIVVLSGWVEGGAFSTPQVFDPWQAEAA